MLDFVKWFLANQFTFSLLMAGLILFIIIHLCAIWILAERKFSAFIQDRKGPNRVGPWGLLQPVADGIKFMLKEDYTPGNVDKPVFILAPAISFMTALIGFAVVPWAGDVHWPWMPAGEVVKSQAADLDVGFLYILAVGSLAVYGVVLAGWASNNKYAFYGGMRATAQMLSYEVPLGLGLLALLLINGSLRLENIVAAQEHTGLWYLFFQPIAFVLVMTSALAETNRTPFDLAECEQELVAGYHTEYAAMKFALFFLGEYAHMTTACAVMTAMFFGGWHIWGLESIFAALGVESTSPIAALIKFSIVWGKVTALILLFMLIRWTIPRYRFDQLMRMAWKSMVPIGMGLVVGNGMLVYFGWHRSLLANLAMNAALLVVALIVSSRATQPITGRQESLPEVRVRPAAQ